MSMLYQTDAIGQTLDAKAAQLADIRADAEAARRLIAYLDAKFGNPACRVCCQPAAADGVYCYECKAVLDQVAERVIAAVRSELQAKGGVQ